MNKMPHPFWLILITLGILAWFPGCAATTVDRVASGLCTFANSLSDDPSQNTCTTEEPTP